MRGTAFAQQQRAQVACRFCAAPLRHTFVDLGSSPLCHQHLNADQLSEVERFYPLHVRVCRECFLVQLDARVSPRPVFAERSAASCSSASDGWLDHARTYAELVTERFGLGARSLVVEVASNHGQLLENFAAHDIPVLGIEHVADAAAVAIGKGIDCVAECFDSATAGAIARERGRADLLIANHVLARVSDINDFVAGLGILLAPGGVLSLEFPHLVQLMERNQIDAIDHEHLSYLSFTTLERILVRHGLVVFDVDELTTHGGSLRVYARHAAHMDLRVSRRVAELREREDAKGIRCLSYYAGFRKRVSETKRNLLAFLIGAKSEGRSIVGYGAPGKGNRLLNYCGIRPDLLDYAVDRTPRGPGSFLPGTRIPLRAPDEIERTRPDYVLILPWDRVGEIIGQMAVIREWKGQFVVPIPELRIYS